MNSRRKQILRWVAVIAYASGIFYVSSLPPLPEGLQPHIPGLDKIAHTIEYAGLCLLVCFASGGSRKLKHPENHLLSLTQLAIVTVAVIAYACTDELHQMFVPGRDADCFDIVADSIGTAGTAILWFLITRRRHVRNHTVTTP